MPFVCPYCPCRPGATQSQPLLLPLFHTVAADAMEGIVHGLFSMARPQENNFEVRGLRTHPERVHRPSGLASAAAPDPQPPLITSFTLVASCLRLKGLGRKWISASVSSRLRKESSV